MGGESIQQSVRALQTKPSGHSRERAGGVNVPDCIADDHTLRDRVSQLSLAYDEQISIRFGAFDAGTIDDQRFTAKSEGLKRRFMQSSMAARDP